MAKLAPEHLIKAVKEGLTFSEKLPVVILAWNPQPALVEQQGPKQHLAPCIVSRKKELQEDFKNFHFILCMSKGQIFFFKFCLFPLFIYMLVIN